MPAAATIDEPPIIEVRNVVKEYRLGALEGLRTLGRRMLGREVPERQRFRALDDVSFSVKRGEVVGIIGHNGAGKSTLLKLLCNITTPTGGSVKVRGRVAPLIEVGAGLVGDMTGRENIFLNASILGLSREQIEGKVDEIIAFAELEQFIDTPIKRYSSGMQVRLGFSIATAVEANVLIIDEVLAVGDLAFQRKCMDRMEKLIEASSRTVLIVGHNIRQLQRICDRVILLDHGIIAREGNPTEVCGIFFREAQERSNTGRSNSEAAVLPQQSANTIKVLAIDIGSGRNTKSGTGALHESFSVEIHFECSEALTKPEIVVGFHTADFVHVLAIGNAVDHNRPSFAAGKNSVTCLIDDLPLRPASYALRVAFMDQYRNMLWYAENIRSIEINAGQTDITLLPEVSLVDASAKWSYGHAADLPSNLVALGPKYD